MNADLSLFGNIAVYAIMGVSVIAAIGVVTLRNLFHAALTLAMVLLGTAAVFISLQAEFLAMVQILIYVGAVMTLIIFAVMLTSRLTDESIPQQNKQGFPAFLVVSLLGAVLIFILLQAPWPIHAPGVHSPVSVTDLAKAMLGNYVFPFEVISVILIAALIGAVTIAKKDS